MRDEALAPIKTAEVAATGDLVAEGTALYALSLHYVDGGAAGSVVLKSGGASGTTLVTMDTPGGAAGEHVNVDRPGLYFADGCHATLTNVDGCTIFYREA